MSCTVPAVRRTDSQITSSAYIKKKLCWAWGIWCWVKLDGTISCTIPHFQSDALATSADFSVRFGEVCPYSLSRSFLSRIYMRCMELYGLGSCLAHKGLQRLYQTILKNNEVHATHTDIAEGVGGFQFRQIIYRKLNLHIKISNFVIS